MNIKVILLFVALTFLHLACKSGTSGSDQNPEQSGNEPGSSPSTSGGDSNLDDIANSDFAKAARASADKASGYRAYADEVLAYAEVVLAAGGERKSWRENEPAEQPLTSAEIEIMRKDLGFLKKEVKTVKNAIGIAGDAASLAEDKMAKAKAATDSDTVKAALQDAKGSAQTAASAERTASGARLRVAAFKAIFAFKKLEIAKHNAGHWFTIVSEKAKTDSVEGFEKVKAFIDVGDNAEAQKHIKNMEKLLETAKTAASNAKLEWESAVETVKELDEAAKEAEGVGEHLAGRVEKAKKYKDLIDIAKEAMDTSKANLEKVETELSNARAYPGS